MESIRLVCKNGQQPMGLLSELVLGRTGGWGGGVEQLFWLLKRSQKVGFIPMWNFPTLKMLTAAPN